MDELKYIVPRGTKINRNTDHPAGYVSDYDIPLKDLFGKNVETVTLTVTREQAAGLFDIPKASQ